jgi:type III restriction enzyme
MNIPPEVEMMATVPNNQGRHSMFGPGKLERIDLNPYRQGRRYQELVFDLARDITRDFTSNPACELPTHVFFPQVLKLVDRYLREKVRPISPAELIDVFLSPYYGWVAERLVNAIHPDTSAGEAPEIPRYEQHRGPGSTADVDYWTSKDVRPVVHCHLNYVVLDTRKWEQCAAYFVDTHPNVEAFVKNDGLGFAVPYVNNGQPHDYIPDFIIRLKPDGRSAILRHLILETKGYDPIEEVKSEAARRWVKAVNADARYGHWQYAVVKSVGDVAGAISRASGRDAT